MTAATTHEPVPAPAPGPGTDAAAGDYRSGRIGHWDARAKEPERSLRPAASYHHRLHAILRSVVPPGSRVLELGCGLGDLLAAMKPSRGVGLDFSPVAIETARARHPELEFHDADVHALDLDETFDYVVLSDLVNDLWDVQRVLERVRTVCRPDTRVVLNLHSRLWQAPLSAARAMGLAGRVQPQNWLTVPDIENLLDLAGFETVRCWQEVLCPVGIPLVAPLCNKVLVKMWPFRWLALSNFVVARPRPVPAEHQETVTVVVAARNESGNIQNIIDRVPELGGGTELIFVEGGSSDDTYETIERAVAAHPDRGIRLFRQPGKGKGDAVREGFRHATGDILMILDADLTVAPEDLPRFYEAIMSGTGEFVNGVRLVYPMEARAMRFFNLLGNKFFSLAFSWLLGQSIKDTLCGTKVMRRRDYEEIAANRAYFGEFDPFGDFDLIFGAARLNRKIVDMPIRYRERTYGDTNIQRWRHGVVLLRMVMFAMSRIKFV